MQQPTPCLVHLTLASDLSPSVFVMYHTTVKQPSAAYVSKGSAPPTLFTGSSVRLKVDEERWVHTVLLSNLTDDTQYRVVAGMPMYPAEAVTFRTAPASSNATVSFLDGG